jgi:hypothetical protein
VRGCPERHAAHVEAFWTIVSYAVVLGIPAFAGYVFYYWFVLIPRREAEHAPPNQRRARS